MPHLSDSDSVRRFAIEHQPVRGQFVRLGRSWLALREHGGYPAPVRRLLGEAVTAGVLLASTLKFEGLLTLQLQGDGAVRLVVAQCTHDFRVRGVARYDESRIGDDFAALVGSGQVTVTVESARAAARYQGVVPIDGASLAASLEHYFAQSEQLPTAVRLAASEAAVGGLLVQRMPAEGGGGTTPQRELASAGADDPRAAVARLAENQRSFVAARAALASLGDEELLLRPAEDLARRCVAGRDVRLYAAHPVSFECRCSPERVAGMLRALGEAEIRDVLAEQGAVTVTCEFCHRPYRFDAVDVEQLFQRGSAPPASPTVN